MCFKKVNTSWKGATTKTLLNVPYYYKITKKSTFKKNSYPRVFCYDVIYDVTTAKTQLLSGKLVSSSSPVAVSTIKWALVTFYDMYLLPRNNITRFGDDAFEIFRHL